jgi:hypothetical protein
MKKFQFTIKALTVAVFMCAFVSLAQAQSSRTFVSGTGDDANPCSRTSPCKTFAGAISKTAACGEIDALDSGGFGTVTITKSITIDGTGKLAAILASLSTGIVVNAQSTDVVTLRGISINGLCNGTQGINVLQAKELNIEDCVIFKFGQIPGNGITVNDSNGCGLKVRNSVIRDNVGDGINVTASAGVTNIALDNVRLSGNANGLHARAGSRVTAHNSVFSNNTANGIFADASPAGSLVNVFVWTSQISLNGANGVLAGNARNAGNSAVIISQNQIDRNTANGVAIGAGGLVDTFSDNEILGNGTDGCPGCLTVGPGN